MEERREELALVFFNKHATHNVFVAGPGFVVGLVPFPLTTTVQRTILVSRRQWSARDPSRGSR